MEAGSQLGRCPTASLLVSRYIAATCIGSPPVSFSHWPVSIGRPQGIEFVNTDSLSHLAVIYSTCNEGFVTILCKVLMLENVVTAIYISFH